MYIYIYIYIYALRKYECDSMHSMNAHDCRHIGHMVSAFDFSLQRSQVPFMMTIFALFWGHSAVITELLIGLRKL